MCLGIYRFSDIMLYMSKAKGNNNFKKPRGGFWSSVLLTLIIFLFISGLYSFFADGLGKKEVIGISDVAGDVVAGKVESITVSGTALDVLYDGGGIKKNTKEQEASLFETLSAYGVTPKQIESVKIEIKGQSGLGYWILNLAPILLPIAFIALFIWFLTRQVKGAGMQAFTFGQSKARMIAPDDKRQRVMFKDVAGVKEAKEGLTEVVDFLRNPKKFLDIGARIPKGILLMGAPGTGKCVTGDTLLITNKGEIRIDEVPKYFSVNPDSAAEGLRVISLETNGMTITKRDASHWYNLSKQDIYEIETESGLSIKGTPEHPIVVVDEKTGNFAYKRLDDIGETDWLVSLRNTQVFGNHTRIPSPDTAYFLGVLTGDGGLTVRNRITLTTSDNEILSKMQKIAREYLGSIFTKNSSRKYDYSIYNASAKSKLLSWGMSETYAERKTVPDWIKIAPKEFITAFIRGLFDTDGSVEQRGELGISSSSGQLINELNILLLNLGIVGLLYRRKKKYNGKYQFYLKIYGDFVEVFRQEIGFGLSRKQSALATVCAKKRNTNVNIVPSQMIPIQTIWRTAVAATTAVTNRAFYEQGLYKNTKRYMTGERFPSMTGLNVFLSGVKELAQNIVLLPEVQHLEHLASGQFFFTKVKTIKKGRATVYDLTVPHTHNFLANGLVNHNTMLARAIAGEANVAFFSISGSEFVELFVGVGASRVRDLFQHAKKSAPAIIFIDEIDAVGRVRGAGVGGGNDEREQTLNQILVEMDGFEPNEKLIIVAASNRPDVLDPALLRPGRFDRRVVLDLPDRNDRVEILKIHARQKPLAEDVNFQIIAERTPGFSGADLYSLMNEGAILAARENRKKASQFDLIRSIEKVMLGPERKSHLLSVKEKEITAYHEAGHAIVASVLPYADPFHKISIISRGRAAGYTLKLPLEDRKMQSRKEFLDDIAVSLGGYIAEKMIFGDLTTGAANDLQVSSALAREMVTRYGMSEKMGPIVFEAMPGRTLFGGGIEGGEQSQEVAAQIDAEVKKIITDAHKKAEEIIKKHRPALNAIAAHLIEIETIEREEFEKILIANDIVPKKKEDIEHAPLA